MMKPAILFAAAAALLAASYLTYVRVGYFEGVSVLGVAFLALYLAVESRRAEGLRASY